MNWRPFSYDFLGSMFEDYWTYLILQRWAYEDRRDFQIMMTMGGEMQ